MKLVKLLSIALFTAGSLGLGSCGCCSGEDPVPALRRLPSFKDIPVQQDTPAAEDAPAKTETPVTQDK